MNVILKKYLLTIDNRYHYTYFMNRLFQCIGLRGTSKKIKTEEPKKKKQIQLPEVIISKILTYHSNILFSKEELKNFNFHLYSSLKICKRYSKHYEINKLIDFLHTSSYGRSNHQLIKKILTDNLLGPEIQFYLRDLYGKNIENILCHN